MEDLNLKGRKLSITFLVKISYEGINCNNSYCLGRKYLKTNEIFPELDKISISLVQINSSYCEISIRCPYCQNLMVCFGLTGFNYEAENRLPDLDWRKVIFQIRNEWGKDVRQPSRKIILDYHLEKTFKPMKDFVKVLDCQKSIR